MKSAVAEQPTLTPAAEPSEAPSTSIVVQSADAFTNMVERLAANPDVPVDKLERLLAMQERILDRNAEATFNAAFAEMAAEIPTVIERGKTDKGTYARLEDIIEAVRPVLRRHGFALSHRTEWPDKTLVKVIGILTHREGHSRQSEFLSGADASGSKNAIQGLGSAVAYGRRYTTKDLLNIATRDEDDDGYSTGKAKATEPAGYDIWLQGMEDLASQGLAALQVEFQKSKREFREYATKHDAIVWARIKTKAGAVKVTK